MPITSSSIFGSEASGGPAWRGFAAAFGVAAALLLAVLLGAAFLLDPYDSGRSPLVSGAGVRPQGPRTAAASRGRDPAFSGAIIGNSHVQLVSPERLAALTGIPFVQLSIPATRPKEQLALIDWFLRHHPGGAARALVIGTDEYWCTGDPDLPVAQPFPFWLLSRSPAEYLGGLVRYNVLEELPRRLGFLLAKRPERARPDGYWDYEPTYDRLGQANDPRLIADRDRRWPDDAVANRTGRYPAAERLAGVLAALPADLRVVLLHPPIYAAGLSPPGTPRAQEEARCKAVFAALARGRPGTKVVDWRVERPETRDPALFFDQTHYRRALAQRLEADIAAALHSAP